jgi:hypothetical protein
MEDSGIQHKQTFTAEPGFGFDDACERVPVVMPEQNEPVNNDEFAQIKQETINRFIVWLIDGRVDHKQIGRQVLLAAYCAKCPGAPMSITALAARMDVSISQASRLANDFKNKFKF